jgi:hypothetical protein
LRKLDYRRRLLITSQTVSSTLTGAYRLQLDWTIVRDHSIKSLFSHLQKSENEMAGMIAIADWTVFFL